MTVQIDNTFINQSSDGIQTIFPYDFLILDNDHMDVFVNSVEVFVGFIITGAGNPTGGLCTFDVPPAAGTVSLVRDTPLDQQVDYIEFDSFPSETHEGALDKLTLVAQEQESNTARTLTLRVDTPLAVSGVVLPPTADASLVWDAAAENLINGPTAGQIAGAEAEADAAAASAAAASTSEGNAATSESNASSSADAAAASAAGIKWKNSTKASTTANITLSGEQTIDDINIVTGDRVLVKEQSSASENGIYVVAAGTWTRSTDLDDWLEVPSAVVSVEEGTAHGDTSWICTSDQGGTIDVTDMIFVLFSPPQALQSAVEAEANEDTYIPPDLIRHNPGTAKASILFKGTGTIAILASDNVTSIFDNGTGNYDIILTIAMNSADYATPSACANERPITSNRHTTCHAVSETVSLINVNTFDGVDQFDINFISVIALGSR